MSANSPCLRIAGLIFALGITSLTGCSSQHSPLEPSPVSPTPAAALAELTFPGEKDLGMYEVTLDPESMTLSSRRLGARSASSFGDVFDLDVIDFIEENLGASAEGEPLLFTGLGITPLGDFRLEFQHWHPFEGTARLATTSPAYLGYTARAVFLVDSAQNKSFENLPEGDVVLEPNLILNNDGYIRPSTLGGDSPFGATTFVQPGVSFSANTFPFLLLADDGIAAFDETGFIGDFRGNRYKNTDDTPIDHDTGPVSGNYNPIISEDGWGWHNWGGGLDGKGPIEWTGFDYVHQGTFIKNCVILDGETLAGNGNYTFLVTILGKWTDPRSSPSIKQPVSGGDSSLFAYRLPHAAYDVSEIRAPLDPADNATFMPRVRLGGALNDTNNFRIAVRDWDAVATEANATLLSAEEDVTKVGLNEAGLPTVEVIVPGAFVGTQTATFVSGTGSAKDPLIYDMAMVNNLGVGGADCTGLIKVQDPEDVFASSLIGEVVTRAEIVASECRLTLPGANLDSRNVHAGDVCRRIGSGSFDVAVIRVDGPATLITTVPTSPDAFLKGDHVQVFPATVRTLQIMSVATIPSTTDLSVELALPSGDTFETLDIVPGWMVFDGGSSGVGEIVDVLDSTHLRCSLPATGTYTPSALLTLRPSFNHSGVIPDIPAPALGDSTFALQRTVSYHIFQVRVAPIVAAVSPLTGISGEMPIMSLTTLPFLTTYADPATYLWDFGEWAVPSNPTDKNPMVQLRHIGTHTGSVTVTWQDCDPVTFNFEFLVAPCSPPTWGGLADVDTTHVLGKGRMCSIGLVPPGSQSFPGQAVVSYVEPGSTTNSKLRVAWESSAGTWVDQAFDVEENPFNIKSTSLVASSDGVAVAYVLNKPWDDDENQNENVIKVAFRNYAGFRTVPPFVRWQLWEVDNRFYHGQSPPGDTPVDMVEFLTSDNRSGLAILAEKGGQSTVFWTLDPEPPPAVDPPDHPTDWQMSGLEGPTGVNGGGGIAALNFVGTSNPRLVVSYYDTAGTTGSLKTGITTSPIPLEGTALPAWQYTIPTQVVANDVGRYNDLTILGTNRFAVGYHDFDESVPANSAFHVAVSEEVGSTGALVWQSPMEIQSLSAGPLSPALLVSPVEIAEIAGRLAVIYYDTGAGQLRIARTCLTDPRSPLEWVVDSNIHPLPSGSFTGTSCSLAGTSANLLAVAYRFDDTAGTTQTVQAGRSDGPW